MKKQQSGFAVRTLVMAVHGALLAMAVMPVAYAEDDPSVAELVKPAQSFEIGVQNVSKGSYKAGEYNGLEDSGVTGIVNFDLRGGGQYDSGDVSHWSLKGTDLGLDTRNLTGEYSQQGKFKINFGYDELVRNRSDSFMSPYLGAGSGNVLTLPGTWLTPVINGSANGAATAFSPANINSPIWRAAAGVVAPMPAGSANATTTAAQAAANVAASNAAYGADVPLWHNVNLSTKRSKADLGVTYNIDPQWQINASVRSENKKGYKPMSTVAAGYSEIATPIADKIDTVTDQFNLSLGYVGDKSFAKAAYYGSVFKNNVNSMTWQDWSAPVGVNSGVGQTIAGKMFYTMSDAPSNQFHQFSLSGGYNFDKTTKLAMDVSYARNTQNDQYLRSGLGVTELGMGVPQNSLDGLVVTKAFNLKLTSKPVQDWSFAANYKYDNRDNRTAVNNYISADAGTSLVTTLPTTANALWNVGMLGWTPTAGVDPATGNFGTGSNPTNINANRAYSKKVNQLNLDATYAIKQGQSVKLGYDLQKIDRYCNGSWISCVDAETTTENILRVDWRGKLTENLTAKAGYAYSQVRITSYNENAFLAVVPMAQYAPAGTTTNGTPGAGGLSLYQTMQTFGITGMGINQTQFQTPAQLAALYPSATPAQLGALQYYFGNGGNGAATKANYASGNNINELIGLRRYNMANRNRDTLKVGADWQASDKLSLQGGGSYKNDKYPDSTYGLTAAKNWALNLDAAYEADESLSLGGFLSYENFSSSMASDAYGSGGPSLTTLTGAADTLSSTCGNPAVTDVNSRNANAKLDPCLRWGANMVDKVNTAGVTLKLKNLMHGKLDMANVLTFTHATTDIGVNGGSYVTNPSNATVGGMSTPQLPGTSAVYWIPASALPTVTTDTITLKVNGKYKLNKASAVNLGYSYSYMKDNDYAYTALQMANSNSNVLPTNETAPHYAVHVVGASYIYSF